jgi:hypothetical protein
VVVIWEGSNYYSVRDLYEAGALPNLRSLGAYGQLQALVSCYDERCVKTHTKPQLATLLTGSEPDIHGIWSDDSTNAIPIGMTVYEKIRSTKPSVGLFHLRFDCQNFGRPTYDNAKQVVDISESCAAWSSARGSIDIAAGVSRMIDVVTQWTLGPNTESFIVLGFDEPHRTGHDHGLSSPEYNEKIRELDQILGQILMAVSPESDVFVISGHGFGNLRVRTGEAAAQEHFSAPDSFIVQRGVSRPLSLYNNDVAAVWLQLFGINPD